ncbi:hypothetical protein KOR34_40810 [Posidoniimonas corsicana]|uniref:DUF4263 domain-containing protein n=1 Tax=Posidoniimonas corsicana TaxID=1938618 RepID=A0A5C5V1G9_9BACT|nr:hypothetical protein KOR34_40810 [Posidoniimonas corsicana]
MFKPKIVNNDRDKLQPVKGKLVWQKRGRADVTDPWQDDTHFKLTTMKAGTGMQLQLSTAELFSLTQIVRGLYGKFWKDGHQLPRDGDTFELADYAKTAASLDALSNLADLLQAVGEEGFADVIRLLTDAKSSGLAIEAISKLQPDDLAGLGAIASLGALREALCLWEANKTNASEEFWQKAFQARPFVLSQAFSSPVVMLAGKSYVGGKNFHNKGGKEVDYLLRNTLTNHLLLVEIKTPCSRLLDTQAYRQGVYAPSRELTGAVAQISNQRDKLLKGFNEKRVETEDTTGQRVRLSEPRCLVIAGDTEQLADAEKLDSFELFRSGLRAVDVITFNELFAKIESLVSLLQMEQASNCTDSAASETS